MSTEGKLGWHDRHLICQQDATCHQRTFSRLTVMPKNKQKKVKTTLRGKLSSAPGLDLCCDGITVYCQEWMSSRWSGQRIKVKVWGLRKISSRKQQSSQQCKHSPWMGDRFGGKSEHPRQARIDLSIFLQNIGGDQHHLGLTWLSLSGQRQVRFGHQIKPPSPSFNCTTVILMKMREEIFKQFNREKLT